MNNIKYAILIATLGVQSKWWECDNWLQLCLIWFVIALVAVTLGVWADCLAEDKRLREKEKRARERKFNTYKI